MCFIKWSLLKETICVLRDHLIKHLLTESFRVGRENIWLFRGRMHLAVFGYVGQKYFPLWSSGPVSNLRRHEYRWFATNL